MNIARTLDDEFKRVAKQEDLTMERLVEQVAEMTVRAMQGGLRIAEVPSLELPRRSGKSNLHAIRDGTRVLRTVLHGHRSGLSGHLLEALANRHVSERPTETLASATSR